jgi:hypothetical protein
MTTGAWGWGSTGSDFLQDCKKTIKQKEMVRVESNRIREKLSTKIQKAQGRSRDGKREGVKLPPLPVQLKGFTGFGPALPAKKCPAQHPFKSVF